MSLMEKTGVATVHNIGVMRCRSCGLVRIDGEPDESEMGALYSDEETYASYVDSQRHEDLVVRYDRTIARLRELSPSDGPPSVFDVGAGSGRFLARARDAGFAVAGNELSEPAIELCRSRYGIALERDLRRSDQQVHSVTMWCVIAHVADPRQLLLDVRARLVAGGILYFHTPRWSAVDTVGFALSRLTGGRFNRLIERRINTAHLRLYTATSMARQLRAAGFEPIAIEPAAELSLNTASYLQSLGFPMRVIGPLARILDRMLARGLAPRNIFNVYAQIPAVVADASSEAIPTRPTMA